ncbi:HAMP domain-containing sensor histidine kinase [Vitiosangium sp. GDMCC 1.1324]|uniref:sensor histidine kinase n=1 Tax=Vitiosangium sp. (strain GDMCC 1.1324) TaxID=2138576 RepID=UPI000D3DA535|nr:HAMP domain-containing sensor histidine kinase [Vitiosangium sp. GDMCC 1.1324]PTL83615.1 hypothetical protein DAT35_09000 [Vitiosangium sp. GDMCC 1.1324]
MARPLTAPRRTLRNRSAAIALAGVLCPLAVVIASHSVERALGNRAHDRAAATARELAERYRSGASDDEVREAAAALAPARAQHVRVVTREGRTVFTQDAWDQSPWSEWLVDQLYGPDKKEAQRAWEAERGPLLARAEVAQAAEDAPSSQCYFYNAGNLYICAAAAWVPTMGERSTRLIHVQGSSRRSLTVHFQSTRHLIKLALFAAALAILLGWWTSAQLVTPVERLRSEVLRRANEAVPRAGIDIGRKDELGDLADAFNTVLTALAERNRNNEAFLADLAHELKNPVAAIRACAERLPETRPGETERLQRLAGVLHQSAVRLDGLVSQLLELARAEAGLHNEQREPVALVTLLGALCRNVGEDSRHPSLTVKLQAPSAIEVAGVGHRLESAFRNLLDNAASFAGPGGWVQVEARLQSSVALVTVSDSGPGISPADLPHVFDRFFTTRQEQRGTGLGLSLARAVIEAHGGRIEVASPPGQGAIFTIHLPQARQSSPGSA